jgi:hypothetical protein
MNRAMATGSCLKFALAHAMRLGLGVTAAADQVGPVPSVGEVVKAEWRLQCNLQQGLAAGGHQSSSSLGCPGTPCLRLLTRL